MIPDSFIDELKYASGIEQVISAYVALKRRGRNLLGLCPFHSEKSPSFTVYPENGSYYCFGCGAGGDVITFVRQIESLEYVEAIKFLANRAGMTVPEDAVSDGAARQKAKILEINREAARFFHERLMSPEGQKALEYLLGRGLKKKTIINFGIGYAPPGWDNLLAHLKNKGFSQNDIAAAAVVTKGRNNSLYDMFRDRVMFPIIDLRGGVIGFGGRIMDGQGPKYLNSPDTPVFKKSRNLFALNFAKNQKSPTMILGEGYMDVVAMHQAGFENSVATLGTSLTAEQSRLLAHYADRIVIAYDSDAAGQTAAKRAINLLAQNDVTVSVLEMRGAKDPDEYIKTHGALRFGQLVSSSKSAINYEIDKIRQKHDIEDSEGKVLFLNEFCALMAGIEGDLQRDVYIGQVARELEVAKERLASTVASLRKKRFASQSRKETHNFAVFAQDNSGQRRAHRGNPGGFIAEENLLALIFEHPDCLLSAKDGIKAEDFLDEAHRKIFSSVAGRIMEHRPLDPIHLSSELDAAQMSRVSHIISKGREIRFLREQAEDYIKAVKAQRDVKNTREVGAMSPEEYDRYITSLTASKK